MDRSIQYNQWWFIQYTNQNPHVPHIITAICTSDNFHSIIIRSTKYTSIILLIIRVNFSLKIFRKLNSEKLKNYIWVEKTENFHNYCFASNKVNPDILKRRCVKVNYLR